MQTGMELRQKMEFLDRNGMGTEICMSITSTCMSITCVLSDLAGHIKDDVPEFPNVASVGATHHQTPHDLRTYAATQ